MSATMHRPSAEVSPQQRPQLTVVRGVARAVAVRPTRRRPPVDYRPMFLPLLTAALLLLLAAAIVMPLIFPAYAAAAAPAPPLPAPAVVRGANTLPTLSSFGRVAPGPTLDQTVAQTDTFLTLSHGFQELNGDCADRGWVGEDLTSRIYAHVSDQFVVNRAFQGNRIANGALDVASTPLGAAEIAQGGQLAIRGPGRLMFFEIGCLPPCTRILYEIDSPGSQIVRAVPGVFPIRPRAMVNDPSTGGVFIADGATDVILYLSALSSTPTVFADHGPSIGSDADTTLDQAQVDAYMMGVDNAGNLYYSEVSGGRIRMIRRNDLRVITLANGVFATAMAVNPDGSELFYVRQADSTLSRLDLGSLTSTVLTGATEKRAIAGAGFMTWSGGAIYFSAWGTFSYDKGAAIFRYANGSLERVAGTTSFYGPASSASAGTQTPLSDVGGLCPDGSGGVYFTNGGLVQRLRADGIVERVAGQPISIAMGARALRFGADMTTAPDEVANWISPSGYGNGWSQRVTSPPVDVSAYPGAVLTFDLASEIFLPTTPDQDVESVQFAFRPEYVSVQAIRPDGSWAALPATVTIPAASTQTTMEYLVPRGAFQVAVPLATAGTFANPTRFRIVVQTSMSASNEDSPTRPGLGGGAAIIDNLRLSDGITELLPLTDFEDGTLNGWTLSAHNGAYESGFPFAQYTRDGALPGSMVQLQSGFDFFDPSCAWTFTSGDSVPPGLHARITSPWIARTDRLADMLFALSGKLNTTSQARVLDFRVRGKNAGESRPSSYFYPAFLLNSGTSGSDLNSPFIRDAIYRFPIDFTRSVEAGPFDCDSIQLVLGVEDRREELNGTNGQAVSTRLPYLDDIKVFERSVDADFDGVADAHDLCPGECAAGQDANGDGCIDATATFHHVETWPAGKTIRYAYGTGSNAIVAGAYAAFDSAFAAWSHVTGAALPLQKLLPTENKIGNPFDGENILSFEDATYPFSPEVLAVTTTLELTRRTAYGDQVVLPGTIVDKDILFNPRASFATSQHPGAFDLRSVATHEVGHLLGLDHSGVADASMYFVQLPGQEGASLSPDDASAIAAAYPSAELATLFGAIRGTVLRDTLGTPVGGALVTAVLLGDSAAVVDTVASDFTDEQGRFALLRLPAGNYGVHVQSLDGSVLDGLEPGFVSSRLVSVTGIPFEAEWFTASDSPYDDPTLKDAVAVAIGATVSGLTVVTNLDTIPPGVVTVSPPDAANGIGIDASVQITFTDPIDASTLNAAFGVYAEGSSSRLAGSALVTDRGRRLVFSPNTPLAFATNYTIQLTGALTDQAGNPLAGAFTSTFTTQEQPPVSITNVQPRMVARGALITISGTGFDPQGINVARFVTPVAGGPDSSIASFVTPTSMVVRVPLTRNVGGDSVRVEVNGEFSNVFGITILPPAEQPSPSASGSPVAVGFAPTDVALAPDASMIYVVGDGGFATVNLTSGAGPIRAAVLRDSRAAHSIVLSPDGGRAFVTYPEDSAVVVYDANPTSATFGAQQATIALVGRPGPIAIAPTGWRAYAGDIGAGSIHELDVQTGSLSQNTQIRQIAFPPGPINGLAVAADNSRLTIASTVGLHYYNFQVGNITPQSIYFGATGGVAASPTGLADIVAGGTDGVLHPDEGSYFVGGSIKDVVSTPQGQAAYLVNQSLNRLQVYTTVFPSPTYRTVIADVATGSSPVAAAVDAGGGLIAVANRGGQSVSIYQVTQSGVPPLSRIYPDHALAGDLVSAQSPLDVAPLAIAQVDLGIGPTFPATLSIGRSAAFRVPDGTPPSETRVSLEWPGPARTLALPFTIVDPIASFTPSGAYLIAEEDTACASSGGATVGGHIPVISLSPDGRRLAVVRESPCLVALDLYDVTTDGSRPFAGLDAKLTIISPGTGETLHDGAFSPDGRNYWAVGSTLGIRRIDVDRASGTFGTRFIFGTGTVGSPNAVLADPLGRFMLVGTSTGTGLTFWDWERDSMVGQNDQVSVYCMAATGDGRTLVMGEQTRASFLDLGTRAITFGTVRGPSGPQPPDSQFISVAVTTDGRRAMGVWGDAFAGTPRRIAVWNLDSSAGPVGQELYFGIPAGMEGLRPGPLAPGPDGHSILAASSFTNHLLKFDLSVIPPVLSIAPAAHAPLVPTSMVRSADGRQLWLAEPGNAGTSATDGVVHLYTLDEASSIELVAGNGQSGFAGTTLPTPITARVTTPSGAPAQGALVYFTTVSGNGSIQGQTTTIRRVDVHGEVQVPWTLPLGGPGDVTLAIQGVGFQATPAVTVTAHVVQADADVLPQIVSFSPQNGAQGLNPQTPVGVRFNQRMKPAVTQSISLLANGSPVTGTYQLLEEGRFVVFQPREPLPHSASCVLAVASGALDTDDQALASGGTSAFTIQAPPTLHVDAIIPPAGPPGAAVTLSGEGFSPLAAQNTVVFNGTIGTVRTATTTGLTLDVPVVATSGPVSVTANSQTSPPVNFIVLPPNADPGGVIGDIPAGAGSRDIALSPDGSRAYITNPPLNTVTVLDLVAVQTLTSVTVGLRPLAVAMLASPQRAYVANNLSNSVSVIDADPSSPTYNRVVNTIPVGAGPVDITVWPGGQKVFVLNAGSQTLSEIDAGSGNATFDQVVSNTQCGAGATQVVISADGTRAYVAVAAGLQILDLVNDQVVALVNCGAAATQVVISADGSLAFVLTADGTLAVIALTGPNANQVVSNTQVGAGATQVVISADGTLAYVSTSDGTVLVFEISAGTSGNTSSTLPGPPVKLTRIETFALGGTPFGLAPDPLGRSRVWVTNSGTGRLHVLGTPDALPRVEVDFDFNPNTLNVRSMGRWAKGTIEPPAPFLAESLVVSTIKLNGIVPADPGQADLGDADHDGVHDLRVRFPRVDVHLLLPPGNHVPVCVEGRMGSRQFYGCDTIRVKHGVVKKPLANEVVPPLVKYQVEWDTGNDDDIKWVSLFYTLDHGATWNAMVEKEPNDGAYGWDVPAIHADSVRIAIVFVEDENVPAEDIDPEFPPDEDVVGVLAMSEPFAIFGATAVEIAPAELSFALTGANPARGGAAMKFGLPHPADVRLELFDVAGRRVKTLARGVHAAGWHTLQWNGTGDSGAPVGAGLYFVRFKAEGREFGSRLIWLR